MLLEGYARLEARFHIVDHRAIHRPNDSDAGGLLAIVSSCTTPSLSRYLLGRVAAAWTARSSLLTWNSDQ